MNGQDLTTGGKRFFDLGIRKIDKSLAITIVEMITRNTLRNLFVSNSIG